MVCTVCGGEARPIATTRKGFDLLRCVGCGLVFCSPMPTIKELEAYYQGFAYSKPDDGEFARQVTYTEAGTRNAVRDIEAMTRRPICRVLDFGGGLGFFANAFSQHYPDVTLFDLDGHSRHFARERFGERFRVVDTAEEALAGKYDLILLNQVIEHVPDPVGFLRSFKGVLESGGVLIVTTPNNMANDNLLRPDVILHYTRAIRKPLSAFLLMFKDSWLCCDPPRHLFAFNGGNLSSLAERCGFGVKRVMTKYFYEDPFGQPKYMNKGFGSARSSLFSFLFLVSHFSAYIAKMRSSDDGGSTLIAYLSSE